MRSDKEIYIIPLGSRVIIGESIEGLITGIALYISDDLLYQVIYWSNGSRQEAWIHEQEILEWESPDEYPAKSRINFPIKT